MMVIPKDFDAEVSILAASLLNPKIIPLVEQRLVPDDFYLDKHKYIFLALKELRDQVDIVTVRDWLERKGLLIKAGGKEYLISLAEAASTSAGWEYWAEIIKRLSVRRILITLGMKTQELAQNPINDNAEILASLKKGIRDLDGEHRTDFSDNSKLYLELYDDLYNTSKPIGLTTGIEVIDNHFYLEPGCTTVVAAESGTGKSSFCLQISDHVSIKYGIALYFSLESTRIALARRQLARHSKVALTRIKKKNIEASFQTKDISNAMNELIDSRLWLIDDTTFQDVDKLISFCESISINQKICMVVIDYIQLMSCRAKSQNRHLEISEISKRFNFLAKDLDCPVIYLSQLNRDAEKRTNRRPTLADLKESGDIRNNADNIIFLYAPDAQPADYPVECFLAKGKDVEYFSVWLELRGHVQTFFNGSAPERTTGSKRVEL